MQPPCQRARGIRHTPVSEPAGREKRVADSADPAIPVEGEHWHSLPKRFRGGRAPVIGKCVQRDVDPRIGREELRRGCRAVEDHAFRRDTVAPGNASAGPPDLPRLQARGSSQEARTRRLSQDRGPCADDFVGELILRGERSEGYGPRSRGREAAPRRGRDKARRRQGNSPVPGSRAPCKNGLHFRE